MARPNDPLLASALHVLEIEAIDNPDAAHLLDLLDSLPELSWAWSAMEVIGNFGNGDKVKSKPIFIAVLLKELSAMHPVPPMLLH